LVFFYDGFFSFLTCNQIIIRGVWICGEDVSKGLCVKGGAEDLAVEFKSVPQTKKRMV